MKIKQALRVATPGTVAFVGAGGKTTTLFRLARELTPPVLVTTTTHLGAWQAAYADQHLIVHSTPDLITLLTGLGYQALGITLITGIQDVNDRLGGLEESGLAVLRDLARAAGASLLIEADGSRQKPLKAPGEGEPVVPSWVDGVIVLAGLAGLGQPLGPETVHRPERFATLAGLRQGDRIDEQALSAVLAHPEGGLKGLPSDALRTLILNQADEPGRFESARIVARAVRFSFDSIVIASMQSEDPVIEVIEPSAGIVLAAGGASRFGGPKMLLEWQGRPLVRRAAEAAQEAGLSPVFVVAGEEVGAIRAALSGLQVTVIDNPSWREGQSTSLRAGLTAAVQARSLGSAVFLLADQPFADPTVIRAVMEHHSRTLAEVVAPRVNGRRANPVLFDRAVFADLLALQGDTGGRAVFDRFPPAWVDWPDERLLFDIDTPEDYERLKGIV